MYIHKPLQTSLLSVMMLYCTCTHTVCLYWTEICWLFRKDVSSQGHTCIVSHPTLDTIMRKAINTQACARTHTHRHYRHHPDTYESSRLSHLPLCFPVLLGRVPFCSSHYICPSLWKRNHLTVTRTESNIQCLKVTVNDLRSFPQPYTYQACPVKCKAIYHILIK